jgi:hypothetical protein
LLGRGTTLAATALAAAAVFGTTVVVQADGLTNRSLKGIFPFNETIVAGIAPFQGDACPTDASQLAITQQFSLTNQGTWGFDGAGHVHMDDTGVQVIVQGGQVSAGYSEAHCDGTYLVAQDATISMDYICSVPANGGQIQFDVHARGVIKRNIIQVAIPPAPGNKARITPVHFASNTGRTLIGCSIVGENTTVVMDHAIDTDDK